MTREPMMKKDAAGSGAIGMTREDVVAFFDRRQQAYDDLDAAALAADYADEAVIESPTAGEHKGQAAAERALQAVFDAFLDMKTTTERLIIDGNHVAQVLSIEGTNLGGLMGLPASGKHFAMAAVFLYELRDSRIVRERRIYDFTGMLVQVGILKAKPV